MRIALLSLAALRCSPLSTTAQAFATPASSLSAANRVDIRSLNASAGMATTTAGRGEEVAEIEIMYCGG
ncbi:unnamed protein product [Ectocarpus sp. 12 AP-2014]